MTESIPTTWSDDRDVALFGIADALTVDGFAVAAQLETILDDLAAAESWELLTCSPLLGRRLITANWCLCRSGRRGKPPDPSRGNPRGPVTPSSTTGRVTPRARTADPHSTGASQTGSPKDAARPGEPDRAPPSTRPTAISAGRERAHHAAAATPTPTSYRPAIRRLPSP